MLNPLLRSGQPHGLPDFPSIRPDHVVPALESLLESYRKGMEEMLAMAQPPGWAMVDAEIRWADDLSKAWSPVSHLNSVADSKPLRDAYNQALEKLTEHENWRQQNQALFRAYRELRESDGFERLDRVQQRIVDLELRDFHLAGVDLPEADQATYRDLVMRLSKLGSRFAENLQDATMAWTERFDDTAGLAGLPEAELNLLAGIARAHGEEGWLVNLSAPSFHAVMTYAEERSLRERVYRAYVTRASDQGPHAGKWDNRPVIDEMLDLRHRLAQLLGFNDYVEYALARRMADDAGTVMAFLQDLAERARPAAEEQFAALSAFADSQGASVPLKAWDIAYWSERLRQAELHLSDEELKPYFPLEQMIAALLHTAGKVFGIGLVQDETIVTWHPDVRFYWLEDADGHRFAGLFMDLFARKDKRGGAWMDVCRTRCLGDDDIQKPVAYLTCNFAPPTGEQPCLMTHDDVQTLFHEFGHCLHHLLTRIDWPQVNGIHNVEWDAVELPSQLMENWCWEEAILGGFARHYRDGKAMPEELKQRLLRSRHFQKALFLVRQLEFAICDMRLHLDYHPEAPPDPVAILEEVRRQVSVVPVPGWNRFLNSFAHIFGGGYAAGYYSYLWAEQLAADAWDRFRAEGAFSRSTGEAYCGEILAVGASRPALESFVAFRGRQPEPGPLLESYGLESA